MRFIPPDLNEAKLAEVHRKGLKWTINHVFNNSSFYKNKFKKSGLIPEDITSLDDLLKLPFTDKDNLQEGYPLPLRSVPFEDLVRIHGSSGTTGKRKVMCYTANDINHWANIFARCYELAGLTKKDRVQLAVGYGLWTAGAGFQAGCERFGAMVVPLGPANADMHCEMLVDLESTVFCSTASMALLMAEEIQRKNLLGKIKLNKIILGAERHSAAMRSKIKEMTGVEDVFDIYGMTELYGPGTGLDCKKHEGIHYWADYFIFEILDPVTLKRLPPGEEGELVVTTLKKEGSPLIRYRTHDITRIIPGACSCGIGFPRHDRITGRSDDMFIYRAVNIYPSQIDHILSRIKDVGSEYQIHLSHKNDGRDLMTIKVERKAENGSVKNSTLSEYVASEMRKKLMVRCNVEIVDYGILPRTERKSQRVFDERNGSTK